MQFAAVGNATSAHHNSSSQHSQGQNMELLIAVLLYLGLLSGTGSYTTTELQALVQNNYQAIETTTSSTSTMETINGDYLQLAGGIEIIDKNVGN